MPAAAYEPIAGQFPIRFAVVGKALNALSFPWWFDPARADLKEGRSSQDKRLTPDSDLFGGGFKKNVAGLSK
jgi:hypothetical protein